MLLFIALCVLSAKLQAVLSLRIFVSTLCLLCVYFVCLCGIATSSRRACRKQRVNAYSKSKFSLILRLKHSYTV